MEIAAAKGTDELESAYETLKQQFKTVNRTLRETNIKLNSKVGELDVLTYYLNSILSHMAQGLIFINLDGFITTCNKTAEELLNIDSVDVIFQPFDATLGDEFFGFSMMEALSTKKEPNKRIICLETKKGIRRELEIEATFLLREGADRDLFHNPAAMDSLHGMIVLIRDITDIHRLQNLANRNDRMKALGEMAAMVAHEIRNPLGGIKGFASLLQRDLKNQPEMQKLTGYIIEGTDNLNRLVTNVLNYARPIKVVPESTDLVGLIHELCQHVRADTSLDPRIKILMETSSHSCVAFIDAQLLKSALLNLIANAIQAMPQGGNVRVSLAEKSKYAIIKVIDNGIGISPENLKKIFSPFFTTKETGNGFGLAEVDQVVRAHAGTIDVFSVVDQGTTFTLKIPLSGYDVNG